MPTNSPHHPRRTPGLASPRGASKLATSLVLLLSLGAGISRSLTAAESDETIRGAPFATSPHAREATLFTRLPADATGVKVENNYADPRMWGDLYHESVDGSLGTGVALGDYDGDGKLDLFVVSKTETCRLFKNLGDFKFEDVTERAGVMDKGPAAVIWKQGVTFVDINNDGKLDLYVCRFRAPNLLYVNQGDGTFKEDAKGYGLDITDSSVMAAFSDYDRDGFLDVYIATNILDSKAHPNGQRGFLLHNNGKNRFTDVSVAGGITGETQSHSATWWDYDNDGWPDLYVANDYGVPDKLYHNNRDGTFTDRIDQVLPHTSHYSMGSDIGDVNNDGLIDFLAADMAASTHQKDQHSIAESREKSEDPEDPSKAPKYRRSALYLNTDTGRCLEASLLAGIAATDWTWSTRFEDLDNDGRLDFFVTNGFNRDPNPDMHQRSLAAASVEERIRIMRDSPILNETHWVYRNLGDLKFENASTAWGLDQKGVAFGAAFGDLDGDGDLDLVYSNLHDTAFVLRNDSSGAHRVVFDLRGTVSNRFGIGAVVKVESPLGVQVRQLTLARGYMSSSEPAVHFGLGNDATLSKVTVTWPSGLVQHFENLPADRRYTLTEPAVPAPALPMTIEAPPKGLFEEVSKAYGLSLSSREDVVDELSGQKLLPLRLNRRGPSLAVGDIDGDGHEDLALGGTSLEPARLLKASGSRFSPLPSPAAKSEVNDGPVLLFDAQANGTQALLVTKGGNSLPYESAEYQPRLFWNDGRGHFTPAPEDALPPLPVSAGAVAAADFTRNGKLGLFIGARLCPGLYPQTPHSALLLNHGGRFEDVTDSLAPALRTVGLVTAALWSDVDLDGWPDLLVALDWGQVKYFHNLNGTTFEDLTEAKGFAAAGSGWWTSLASADFNGDGRPDFIAGNVGLNTPYHASPAGPAVLYSGDFKGKGSNQLIEGFHEGSSLFPRRSRRTLAAVVPTLMKKFPRNELYERATLQKIFGEDKLAAAERHEATQLSSGVFLSNTDGSYHFEALPRLAQISPLQGLVAGDFDGDSHADIYAVQNSYAPIPVVGRFDGGLSQLLLGDGRGHFNVVPPAFSQLLVPGDGKALCVTDLNDDGAPDFVVSRNQDSSLAFLNRGQPGRQYLRIVLKGPAGNPTSVGARLSIEYRDHSKATVEVFAGSGYTSQSSPAAFIGYLESNPPVSLEVVWPGGKTSTQRLEPGTTHLELSKP